MAKETGPRCRNRRTTAVYFKSDEELAAVKEAARLSGVDFTALIREAAIARARRVLKKAA